MSRTKVLVADKHDDSDRCREAFEERGVTPRMPPGRSGKVLIFYDEALYITRHKIENISAKFKN